MLQYLKNKWHKYFHKNRHMKTLTHLRATTTGKFREFYIEYGLLCDCGIEENFKIKEKIATSSDVNLIRRYGLWRELK